MDKDREQSEGMIYTNDYRQNDKQPNWTGSLVLQKAIVKELVEKNNLHHRLSLSQ